MSLVSDLAHLMTDTLTWRPLTGRNEHGLPTYASPGTSFQCRLTKEGRLVRNIQGDEVLSTSHAWINGHPDVLPDDKIVLSNGGSPTIASVERFQGPTGWSHTKVYFL